MASVLADWTFIVAVIIAAVLEIAATLLLAKSKGFTRLPYAVGSLAFVALAFSFLAYAVRGMDVSVAYALWGGFGVLGTSLGGWILFGQRLRSKAWFGISLLIGGMVLLNFA